MTQEEIDRAAATDLYISREAEKKVLVALVRALRDLPMEEIHVVGAGSPPAINESIRLELAALVHKQLGLKRPSTTTDWGMCNYDLDHYVRNIVRGELRSATMKVSLDIY